MYLFISLYSHLCKQNSYIYTGYSPATSEQLLRYGSLKNFHLIRSTKSNFKFATILLCFVCFCFCFFFSVVSRSLWLMKDPERLFPFLTIDLEPWYHCYLKDQVSISFWNGFTSVGTWTICWEPYAGTHMLGLRIVNPVWETWTHVDGTQTQETLPGFRT